MFLVSFPCWHFFLTGTAGFAVPADSVDEQAVAVLAAPVIPDPAAEMYSAAEALDSVTASSAAGTSVGPAACVAVAVAAAVVAAAAAEAEAVAPPAGPAVASEAGPASRHPVL